MSATQIGKGRIRGLSGGAISAKDGSDVLLSGYVSPNLQSLRVSHQADVKRGLDQDGDIASLSASGEFLECQFDIVPEGSTIANAKKSAGLPPILGTFEISGLPIIAMGAFTDALNTDDANTQRWVYEGDGEINVLAEDDATMSLTLRRYPNMTGTAVISS